jgi:hypothetical protein
MVAICSSEISEDFQRAKLRYIPEYTTLHDHRCENVKLYNFYVAFETPSDAHESSSSVDQKST